MIPWQVGKPLT